MKNVKTGLLTLVSVLGIAGAFAKAKPTGTTYFAKTDGAGSFVWTTVRPSNTVYVCLANPTPYCTILTNGTGYVPTNGQAPDPLKISTHTSAKSLFVFIP
jgi:hypothetical protein